MSDFHPAYFEAAIRGEVERVAAAGASTRNETLNKAAFNLASLGVSGSEIIHSLRPAALQCGLKNGEIYSTINSGMRAGKQHPRAVPTNSRSPSRNVGAASAFSATALPHQESTDNLSALPLPTCDAPDKFKVYGDKGPAKLEGELRRHVYQNPRRAVRVKIKLGRAGEIRWQNWYAVVHDGATGWQAQKPEGYIDIPYVTRSIDPFDPELKNGELHWTEGEKDVDTLDKLNLPAFSFGGTGDGLTADVERHLKNYLNGRHLIIYADNDDGGRSHADKKAAFGYSADAANIRIVHFPQLPPKGDVSDFIANGGTAEQLMARIDAAPLWSPPVVVGDRDLAQPVAENTWDDPDWELLDDRRGKLPEFPIDALVPGWQDYVERAAHGAGVTTAHVAVPLITIASGVIGSARRIEASRSWTEPATLWSAVVGFSGSGKTPGIDVSKRTLAFIEKNRREKIASLQREHETLAEAARAAQKKWKKEVEEAIAAGSPPPSRPVGASDVGEFVAPRLYVSDITTERLAVLLQARPRGMMVIADELAGLFLNMGRYSNGSDREFWLEAWNGKHFIVERMGRPAVAIDHLLVGITGGLQPDKLVRSFQGDADGMYARVCFAWPPEPSYRPLCSEVAEIEDDIVNALTRLIEMPAESDTGFSPRAVPLSNEATATFEQFRQFLHAGKAALDAREREWWAKGASQVLRLSGTLAFMAWSFATGSSEPGRIEQAFMASAIRIWRDYFWPHSRAALRQIGISERHANSRKVLKWIRATKTIAESLSLKDVRREALSQSIDAKQTADLMDGLERAGWVKKVTTETGGRPAHRWKINERLFQDAGSAETAERRSIIDATPGPATLPALSALPAGERGLGHHEAA